MFKQMWKPGLTAGIIGGIVSLILTVLTVLALTIPGSTGTTLFNLSSPLGYVLMLLIGLLAAWLAQARSLEKLRAGQLASAGVIAGAVHTIVGLPGVPILFTMLRTLNLEGRFIEMQMDAYRRMNLPPEQIELARIQIQTGLADNSLMMISLVGGLIVGLILSIALGAGGAALGTFIFKPRLRRKLVCEKCQAAFELGGNSFIEVRQGQPDLADYCTWDDLMPDVAKQQRIVVAEVIKSKGVGRQWQCGMCKAVQAY